MGTASGHLLNRACPATSIVSVVVKPSGTIKWSTDAERQLGPSISDLKYGGGNFRAANSIFNVRLAQFPADSGLTGLPLIPVTR